MDMTMMNKNNHQAIRAAQASTWYNKTRLIFFVIVVVAFI